MPAEKIESVILSVAPYRETSAILRLFTRERGLIHGIAKGIRGVGKTSTPIDRGFLLDALLYHKPTRELHTLGNLHIGNFFTGIRADITKTAIRDIALELYLKTITQHDHPHSELYELMITFLTGMDESSIHDRDRLYPALWRFICDYCALEGFNIGAEILKSYGIEESVIRYINGANKDITTSPRPNDCLYITEKLLQYCRTHFDITGNFNSFAFVKAMV